MVLIVFALLFTLSCRDKSDAVREYGWFEFVIPDSDTTSNAVDMSFLNEKIAGGSGYITLKDGHFADGKEKR